MILLLAGSWDSEVDGRASGSSLSFLALGAKEGEREVDALDLAEPILLVGPPKAREEVGFEFFEAVEHLRVDVEHRASDAGMFVLAGGTVGAPAGAEFDLSAVEVLLELVPFLVRRVAVLALRPDLTTVVEKVLVVADDVLVEDRDVATGGLDVEMAHESGADVDRQAAVDQLGSEDPSEIVRGELQPAELPVVLGQLLADPGPSMTWMVAVLNTMGVVPFCRWKRNGIGGLHTLSW